MSQRVTTPSIIPEPVDTPSQHWLGDTEESATLKQGTISYSDDRLRGLHWTFPPAVMERYYVDSLVRELNTHAVRVNNSSYDGDEDE